MSEPYYKCPICGNEMRYSHTHWSHNWDKFIGYKCIKCEHVIYK